MSSAWQTVGVTLFDAGTAPGTVPTPGTVSGTTPGPSIAVPERARAGSAQVKFVVAYDGTDFSGFAAQSGQPGVRTVGGVLAGAIAKVLRHDVRLACAGRT